MATNTPPTAKTTPTTKTTKPATDTTDTDDTVKEETLTSDTAGYDDFDDTTKERVTHFEKLEDKGVTIVEDDNNAVSYKGVFPWPGY